MLKDRGFNLTGGGVASSPSGGRGTYPIVEPTPEDWDAGGGQEGDQEGEYIVGLLLGRGGRRL